MRRIVGVVALLTAIGPVRADDDAKLRAVIDKAIKETGGAEKLSKFKGSASKSKGKFYGPPAGGEGIEYTGATSLQLPDRIRTEVDSEFNGQKFKFVQVVNGDKGWILFGDQTHEMSKEMLAEAREQMNTANIVHLAVLSSKDYSLSALGEMKVGDRQAIGVRVERKGFRPVSLFFDKENGLLLKTETRGKDPMRGGEEFTAETIYGDYKKVEGVRIAHKVTIKRDGKPFVDAEVTEVKLSEKLDESVFDKP